jgi:hypothetical protein
MKISALLVVAAAFAASSFAGAPHKPKQGITVVKPGHVKVINIKAHVKKKH